MTELRRRATRNQRLLIETCLELGVPFWWRGPGTLLISASGVVDVIQRIELHARVVGLEGFDLHGTEIDPRLDLIYDASVTQGEPSAVAAAWGEDVWVDVTIASD